MPCAERDADLRAVIDSAGRPALERCQTAGDTTAADDHGRSFPGDEVLCDKLIDGAAGGHHMPLRGEALTRCRGRRYGRRQFKPEIQPNPVSIPSPARLSAATTIARSHATRCERWRKLCCVVVLCRSFGSRFAPSRNIDDFRRATIQASLKTTASFVKRPYSPA